MEVKKIKKRHRLICSGFLLGLFWLGSSGLWADAPPLPAGSTPVAAQSSAVVSQTGHAQAPSVWSMFVPFLLMFAVIYFLMIRPQQKRTKEQKNMVSALKHGDQVLTNAGMIGKITGISDKVVTLEVADNVRIKFLKSQVAQVIKGPVQDLATS